MLGAQHRFDVGFSQRVSTKLNVSFKEVGEFLGIKFSGRPNEKIEGIGKTLKGWKHPIDIEFLNQKFSIDVIWLN